MPQQIAETAFAVYLGMNLYWFTRWAVGAAVRTWTVAMMQRLAKRKPDPSAKAAAKHATQHAAQQKEPNP